MPSKFSIGKAATVRTLIRGAQRTAIKKALRNLLGVLNFDNRLVNKYGPKASAFLYAMNGKVDPAFLQAQGVILRLSSMLNAKALIGVVPGAGSPPVVTGVAPGVGPAAGGTAVTLTGVNFTGATQVVFDTTIAPVFVVLNDNTIQVTTPAHAVGAVSVFVEGPQGASFGSSDATFTYQ